MTPGRDGCWAIRHRHRCRAALALAEELAHPYSSAWARSFIIAVHGWCGELQATREHAEAAVALSLEQGFTLTWIWATIMRSMALARLGHGESQVEEATVAMQNLRDSRTGLWMQYYLAATAEIQGTAGQADEALSVLDEAIEVGKNLGERCYEAELYRMKGDMTLLSDGERPDSTVQREAEACFEQALKTARGQSAKSWELRAATSLARLWQQQGKLTEAHKLLSNIYNWFTEGFDTKDLQDAKALLEELV